jgi:hypothetical protein
MRTYKTATTAGTRTQPLIKATETAIKAWITIAKIDVTNCASLGYIIIDIDQGHNDRYEPHQPHAEEVAKKVWSDSKHVNDPSPVLQIKKNTATIAAVSKKNRD